MDSPLEAAARQRIFTWVADRAARNGGWVSRDELLKEYRTAGGDALPLIDYSRGIRNPQSFEATLSIVQSLGGPYDDRDSGDGLLHYSYRRGSTAGDNRKLRVALELGSPLLLLVKPEPNVYVPIAPVYVVGDDEMAGEFVIALDESFRFMADTVHLGEEQRRYAVRLARTRLHQPVFRGRVVRAYGTRCAICRLGHGELLEAAHIYPDAHERGLPVVTNGLSLCSIHHTAYDRNLLGIDGDSTVHLDAELLEEVDGPMLRYGLQAMDGETLLRPARASDHPNPDALAWRFEQFSGGAASSRASTGQDTLIPRRSP